MPLELRALNLGKVDGKAEYLEPKSERDHSFFDAFLIPESVDPTRFSNSDLYFIEGFRGTGKTSLLRWFAEDRRRVGAATDFVLFKSDVPEDRRLGLSAEVGITWVQTDTSKMEVSQDFKSSWTWFIHHKLAEMLLQNVDSSRDAGVKRYGKLLGQGNDGAFSKVIGFLPKLEGSKVTIKADLPFFEAELEGDFVRDKDHAKTTL